MPSSWETAGPAGSLCLSFRAFFPGTPAANSRGPPSQTRRDRERRDGDSWSPGCGAVWGGEGAVLLGRCPASHGSCVAVPFVGRGPPCRPRPPRGPAVGAPAKLTRAQRTRHALLMCAHTARQVFTLRHTRAYTGLPGIPPQPPLESQPAQHSECVFLSAPLPAICSSLQLLATCWSGARGSPAALGGIPRAPWAGLGRC